MQFEGRFKKIIINKMNAWRWVCENVAVQDFALFLFLAKYSTLLSPHFVPSAAGSNLE